MSTQERLAEALLAADDLDPGFANDLAIDDDVAPEMARILTIADEHLSQDIADGQALRLLREACETAQPYRAWFLAEWSYARSGDQHVEVRVEKHVGDGSTRFRGATIADAADACRKALEERS